jgi:hypothetical protein
MMFTGTGKTGVTTSFLEEWKYPILFLGCEEHEP